MTARESKPALLGGQAIRPQGPPDWPRPDGSILEALEQAFRDGSWGKYHGGRVQALEEQLKEAWQVPFALTCASGTFAVELALRALRVGSGDEVILAGYDYPGNFLCVHAVGAHPVLVDVNRRNATLDTRHLLEACSPRTRVILVSHLHGAIVPMRDLCARASELGLAIIEDAAQAPGAQVQSQPAGTWGDVGILSFGGSKLLSAGRGGAILTRRADLNQRARLVLNRGNHICPLSELQAAVLLPQLQRLTERNAQRRRAVHWLKDRLHAIPGLHLFGNEEGVGEPTFYKVGFYFDQQHFGLSRETFTRAVRAEGIALDVGFRALNKGRSPSRFRAGGSLTETERAGREIVILHHPVLLGSELELEEVAQAIEKVHAHANVLTAESGMKTEPEA